MSVDATEKNQFGRFGWERRLELPLPEDRQKGWRAYPIFQGRTPCLMDFGCHFSVLSPGRRPHRPHKHHEEEILVLLGGEAELILPHFENDPLGEVRKIKPGSFAYYPAGFHHTLHNPGTGPATYLMFKWQGKKIENPANPIPASVFDIDKQLKTNLLEGKSGPIVTDIFRGRTRILDELACRMVILPPGKTYRPPAIAWDSGILVLRGSVIFESRRMEAVGVLFSPAGEPCRIQNIGVQPAACLVFEFHGRGHGWTFPIVRKRIWMKALKIKKWIFR